MTVVHPQELERFRTLLELRLGLTFDDAKLGLLSEVLGDRLHKTRSDVASYLREVAHGKTEPRELAERLTVGETYFFRNEDHFRAFVEIVLPSLLRARSAPRRLRVLSAGCASGDEAHTIAILLRERGLTTPSDDIQILGIDVNPAAVKRASSGRYSTWSLRQTSPTMQSRYFREAGSEFLLDDEVRRAVRFEERNLLEEDASFWEPGSFDVVFCRNVTMYFASETTRAVVGRIARSLTPGGFLFLGHAETLRGISQDFHLRHTHDTFYYQKKEAETCVAPAIAPRETREAWVDAINRASERVTNLTAPNVDERGSVHSQGDPSAPNASGALAEAMELLRRERYSEAREALERLEGRAAEDPDVQLFHAVLRTNAGEAEEAERLCERILVDDELHAGAHYLISLSREQAGDLRRAEDHDRTAAYLDPSFAMPRLHLGLMARKAGNLEMARAELGRALVLLRTEEPLRVLLLGGGFGRESLIELCRAELRRAGGGS